MRVQNVKRVISLVAISYCLFATESDARLGGCTAAFLGIGGGARAIALGGAYSAFAEGVDAVYWNPAGIAKLTRNFVNFTHADLYADITQENIGAVVPVPDGAVGVSAIALLSGKIEETTYDDQDGTGRYWSANDFAVGLTYARRMTDKFNAGFTIKGINQNIDKVSANGLVFDVGGTYDTKLKGLRFGFMIQNFGQDVAFSGEGLREDVIDTLYPWQDPITGELKPDPDPMPMTFQLGLAVDILNMPSYKFTLMSDLIHPSDQDATYGVGGEVSFLNSYFLRLGYTEKNSRGLTAGVGAVIPLGGVTQGIVDYTYEVHQWLPGIHRIGLGFAF